ncbi:ankyrin repeat domain-containing protein [Mycobacterium sp. MYCO198283]|uniref:ankyrin repeat domain-containing protein n=1 Tax=Mycobacterium sp. MYCO198283 TaxID=2883505 RepID=UPI0035ABD9AD
MEDTRDGQATENDPYTPIHKAVLDNDLSTLSVEPALGDSFHAPGPDGVTPLHFAANYGRVDIAKALLDEGVDSIRWMFGGTLRCPVRFIAAARHALTDR